MDEEADLGAYASLLLSTIDLEELLHESGAVDEATHEKASRFLRSQDRGSKSYARTSVLEGRVYLDKLALAYLQSAGILKVLEDSRFDFRIHPSIKEEQIALIESGRERQRLEASLEKLRVMLRDALQERITVFLPRHEFTEEDERGVLQIASTLGELLNNAESFDAIAIDDRYLQRFGKVADSSGQERPVIGVIDIMSHLERQGVIKREKRYAMLHELRQSGFAFVMIEAEELLSYLRTAPWKDNEGGIEGAELRILRQTLGRIRSLEMLTSAEVAFLGELESSCLAAIRQIWTDETIEKERAVWMTDWIWNHISPSPLGWMKQGGDGAGEIMHALASHLTGLLIQMVQIPLKKERLESLLEWAQKNVLSSLLMVNSGIVDRSAQQIGRLIEKWSVEFAEGYDGNLAGSRRLESATSFRSGQTCSDRVRT